MGVKYSNPELAVVLAATHGQPGGDKRPVDFNANFGHVGATEDGCRDRDPLEPGPVVGGLEDRDRLLADVHRHLLRRAREDVRPCIELKATSMM
jgi:hypothetical protein